MSGTRSSKRFDSISYGSGIRSKPSMPGWHEDKDSRAVSLVITRAGRDAIGINEPDVPFLRA
jgi:hypothetical protein